MDVFLRVSAIKIVLPVTITWGGLCPAVVDKWGVQGGEWGRELLVLGGHKTSRVTRCYFFICLLKTGHTVGSGRVRRGTRVIISTVGILSLTGKLLQSKRWVPELIYFPDTALCFDSLGRWNFRKRGIFDRDLDRTCRHEQELVWSIFPLKIITRESWPLATYCHAIFTLYWLFVYLFWN